MSLVRKNLTPVKQKKLCSGRSPTCSPKTLQIIGRILFYVGFGTWLAWKVISTTMFSLPDGTPGNTLIHAATLAIVAASVTTWLRDLRWAFLFISMFTVGALCWINSGAAFLLDTVIMIFAATPWSKHKTIAFSCVIVSSIVILTIAASQMGVIEDYLWPRVSGEIRHGLGFLYCTFPSHYLFFMTMAYVYVKRGNLRIAEYMLIILAVGYVYILTDSRNAAGLTILFLISISLLHFKRFRRLLAQGRWRYVVCSVFAVFAVMSIVITIAYNGSSPLWASANQILSGRLQQTNESFNRYGVEPFGQRIELTGNSVVMGEDGIEEQDRQSTDTNYVDNAYLNSLINYGWIPTILLLILLTTLILYSVARSDVVLFLVGLFMGVHALLDPQLIALEYNVFLIVSMTCLKSVIADKSSRSSSCDSIVV